MEVAEKKRCVIVAAGGNCSDGLLKENIKPSDFIIAADAGYLKCRSAGFKPDLFIGDYDSSCRPKTDSELICLNPIKDATDSDAALSEAEARGYKNVLLLGGTGGRIDHTASNIILSAAAIQRGTRLTVIDNHHRIFALKNEKICIERAGAKHYLSIFAVGGECRLSISGVFYPLSGFVLSPFAGGLGVSNEITAEEAVISVEDGTVIVIEADSQ